MLRVLAWTTLLLGLPLSMAQGDEVRLNGHTFTIPAGFEIELIAGPPLVDRPITAAFDEAGNLYVTDSSGSNDNVNKQLEDKPHRILRLSDTDGDGKFDRQTVFGDKLMFPEGTMWLDGSVYVAAPPSIWKLTDHDGDGVSDERVEWFQGKTLTGCANDLHGPYAGPDGWVYWCKGAFAEQTYPRPGRSPLVTKASHIFRCRPDGTGLESVMTGGMDNPVDVSFTPTGERILTNTFLIHPGGGQRDGLIHAIYGGVYGKVHAVLDGHPRTGEIMPVLSHMGPAAPCGLTTLESAQCGTDYQFNLLACSFNLHKVTRHVLTPAGGMYASQDSDFVVSDNVDFHPTDVLEDADGSILILDTGGWYKLCCPTSQLSKPDVLGAIYRVRRKAAARWTDARGLQLAFPRLAIPDLVKLLDDPRPVVRQQAIRELGRRNTAAIPLLAGVLRVSDSVLARQNAIWALTRIDQAGARAAIRDALNSRSDEVRQTALNAVSLWRDANAVPHLNLALRSGSLMSQRLAAEGLGRTGDVAAVPKLLAAAEAESDRVRDHALIYALIELGDVQATAAGLQSPHPAVQRVAMIAIDQMPGGALDPQLVAAALSSPHAGLRETAGWILEHHPEWGDTLAQFLRQRLQAVPETDAERDELERQLSRFAQAASVQTLLAEVVSAETSTRDARLIALLAMQTARLKGLPAVWATSLESLLASSDAELVARGVAVLRVYPPAKGAAHTDVTLARLQELAANDALPMEVRLDALAVLGTTPREWSDSQFQMLAKNLDPEKTVALRSVASEVIASSRLTTAQLLDLTESLKSVGPLEVDRLLSAYEAGGSDEVGARLVAALKEASALRSLRVDALKLRLSKFSPKVQEQAAPLYEILNADAARQKERLEQLLTQLKDGDVRRGQQVFYSQKAACVACHAIGYVGGNTGPDLTRIGGIRTERDLLESIVFPSVSFVRSYEPVTIVMTSGKVHNGLIRKETPDELTVATGPREEVRLTRSEIEEINPSSVSIMPAGLDQQLTVQQLADLIAFLKNAK